MNRVAGLPNLQGVYDASTTGAILLDTTRGAFEMDGAGLAAGLTGTAGPDYMMITRGATNILNTAYNATDFRATIYSGALNGMDISPDPGLFPDRATISVTVDRLQFLRQDRVRTSVQLGFFNWSSTVSLDFASASAGGFITLGGIFEFRQSASGFGMGNAILHSATWKNQNGVVANLGPGFLFANNALYQADGASISIPQARIFLDNSRYNIINAGILTGGAIGHVTVWCAFRVDAGVTLAQRRGLFFPDTSAIGAGTITTQVAVDIENLDFATTNIGIRSVMATGGGRTFISHTGSAPSLFGGDVEFDGALNHDGTTAGFYATTPVTRPASYSITNSTPSRTLNVSTVTLTSLANVVAQMLQDMGDVAGNGLLDTSI